MDSIFSWLEMYTLNDFARDYIYLTNGYLDLLLDGDAVTTEMVMSYLLGNIVISYRN